MDGWMAFGREVEEVVRGRRRVRGPSVYIEFGRGGGDRGQARAGEEGERERERSK
jgi:hypothetical protein